MEIGKGVVSIIILVVAQAVLIWSRELPENAVWTLPKETFWIGDHNVSLPCEFKGDPFAVYWMKDSTDNTLITWYREEVSGPGLNDGSVRLNLTDYSLIISSVSSSTGGKYICRVSNANGYLIANETDVKVLDPKVNIVYTVPGKTVWAGGNLDLPCDFVGTPTQVLWNKVEMLGSLPRVETVLKYDGEVHQVIGDRRFGWGRNNGLLLRDLAVGDEGNYTCKVWKTDDNRLMNTTVLTVHAEAEKPYIQIKQCEDQQSNPNDQEVKCLHNVTNLQRSFQLDCSVFGAKPSPDVFWEETGTGRIVSDKGQPEERPDGRYDVTVTFTGNASLIGSGLSYTCNASGIAVDGTTEQVINLQRVIVANVPPTEKAEADGGSAVVAVIATLIVLIVLCGVYLILNRLRLLPEPLLIKACAPSDTTSQKLVNDVESGKPLLAELSALDIKRNEIRNYKIGDATNATIEELPAAIHIGVFGVMSVGKSALINSLHIALTGNKKTVVDDASTVTTGARSLFRDSTILTKDIVLFDNRGTRDLNKNLEKEMMAQIRGDRGRNPNDIVEKGKEIHCPVFIFNASAEESIQETMRYLKSFSNNIHQAYGRHAMVVMTHKAEVRYLDIMKEKVCLETSIPRGNVWAFDNYTKNIETGSVSIIHKVGKNEGNVNHETSSSSKTDNKVEDPKAQEASSKGDTTHVKQDESSKDVMNCPEGEDVQKGAHQDKANTLQACQKSEDAHAESTGKNSKSKNTKEKKEQERIEKEKEKEKKEQEKIEKERKDKEKKEKKEQEKIEKDRKAKEKKEKKEEEKKKNKQEKRKDDKRDKTGEMQTDETKVAEIKQGEEISIGSAKHDGNDITTAEDVNQEPGKCNRTDKSIMKDEEPKTQGDSVKEDTPQEDSSKNLIGFQKEEGSQKGDHHDEGTSPDVLGQSIGAHDNNRSKQAKGKKKEQKREEKKMEKEKKEKDKIEKVKMERERKENEKAEKEKEKKDKQNKKDKKHRKAGENVTDTTDVMEKVHGMESAAGTGSREDQTPHPAKMVNEHDDEILACNEEKKPLLVTPANENKEGVKTNEITKETQAVKGKQDERPAAINNTEIETAMSGKDVLDGKKVDKMKSNENAMTDAEGSDGQVEATNKASQEIQELGAEPDDGQHRGDESCIKTPRKDDQKTPKERLSHMKKQVNTQLKKLRPGGDTVQEPGQQSQETGAGPDEGLPSEEVSSKTPSKDHQKTTKDHVSYIKQQVNVQFKRLRPGGHEKLMENEEVVEAKNEKTQDELEEEERNIEFLEFILACLDMAERNILHKQQMLEEKVVKKHWYSRFMKSNKK